MCIYSDKCCQVVTSSSEGWGQVWESGVILEVSRSVGTADSEEQQQGLKVETKSSFQQLVQGILSPDLWLLGLLMPPLIPAQVADAHMSRNAFKAPSAQRPNSFQPGLNTVHSKGRKQNSGTEFVHH